MAGIPVHMSSPINPNAPATAAASPTTTTTEPENRTRYAPASVAANTTAVADNAYQSASPAAAVPTPTSTASQNYTPTSAMTTPTRTVPPPPIGTRDSPPPPQPGQAPVPGVVRSTSQNRNTKRPSYAEPPQPQPSGSPAQLITPAPAPTSFFNNMTPPPPAPSHATYLPPLQTQAPTTYAPPSPRFRDTFATNSHANITSISSPVAISPSYPQQDLSHPPGYRQDHRASFADQPIEEIEAAHKTHTPSPTRKGWGILDAEPTLEAPADSAIWDTAVNWAKAAGKKLSVGEAQIWKALNGDD